MNDYAKFWAPIAHATSPEAARWRAQQRNATEPGRVIDSTSWFDSSFDLRAGLEVSEAPLDHWTWAVLNAGR